MNFINYFSMFFFKKKQKANRKRFHQIISYVTEPQGPMNKLVTSDENSAKFVTLDRD